MLYYYNDTKWHFSCLCLEVTFTFYTRLNYCPSTCLFVCIWMELYPLSNFSHVWMVNFKSGAYVTNDKTFGLVLHITCDFEFDFLNFYVNFANLTWYSLHALGIFNWILDFHFIQECCFWNNNTPDLLFDMYFEFCDNCQFLFLVIF